MLFEALDRIIMGSELHDIFAETLLSSDWAPLIVHLLGLLR